MSNAEAQIIINELIGKPISKVNVGPNAGSIIGLEIGDKLKSSIKWGQQFDEADNSLLIYCAWRLDDERRNRMITGWRENNELNGPLVTGVKLLEGDVIESLTLSNFFDLTIAFRSGKKLLIFNDLTSNVDADSNWVLSIKNLYYSITPNLECIVEQF